MSTHNELFFMIGARGSVLRPRFTRAREDYQGALNTVRRLREALRADD